MGEFTSRGGAAAKVFKAWPWRSSGKNFWGVSVAQTSAPMVSAIAGKTNALRVGRPGVGKAGSADALRAASRANQRWRGKNHAFRLQRREK